MIQQKLFETEKAEASALLPAGLHERQPGECTACGSLGVPIDELEAILIDKTEFLVPIKVVAVMDKLKHDNSELRKQLDLQLKGIKAQSEKLSELQKQPKECKQCRDYEYMFGQLQAGFKVSITGAQSKRFVGEKLKADWEAEVKYGMAGWLQAHWGQLCKVQCNCGSYVSYDVLRASNELKCKECASGQTCG